VSLGARADNTCDGNLYDAADDNCAFHIAHPAPEHYENLAGWQRYYQLDTHSTQAPLTAEFDPATGILRWQADGPLPETQVVAVIPGERLAQAGPVTREE
jgi:hypothetical protein